MWSVNPPLHFHYVITYVHNTLRAAAAASVTLFARMKREISSSFVVPIKFYLMMMTIRPLQQGMRFFPNGRQFLLWGVGCFPPSASLSLSLWSCPLEDRYKWTAKTAKILPARYTHWANYLPTFISLRKYFIFFKAKMFHDIWNTKWKRVNLYKMTKYYTNSK